MSLTPNPLTTSREQIIQQVNEVLMEGFEVEASKLNGEAHLFHDLGIDSLDAIDMLVYIEEKIGRTVDATLFKNVRKVADIYDVMERELLGTVGGVLPEPQPEATSV